MRNKMTKSEKKVKKVMREFKKGELPIGKSKKKVKSRKQAIAIALSEAGKSKPRRKNLIIYKKLLLLNSKLRLILDQKQLLIKLLT